MNGISDVIVVGLTGQSGAGKTTVCNVFKDNGFIIINADQISREVVGKGSPCLKELFEAFSDEISSKDESLDRQKLANIVFSDKGKLNLLGSIIYPYITAKILEEIKRYSMKGEKLIILDAPTLFESRADDFCELIISVIADEETRIDRIIDRDGISIEQAKNRLQSQHDDLFYTDNSDFIIKNNKNLEMLREKAKEVSDKIKEYYDAKEA